MRPEALGVNCGPAHTLAKPLAELRAICGPDFPLIAYGNIGYADEALVVRIVEFIRAGKRPLTMAVNRNEAGEES